MVTPVTNGFRDCFTVSPAMKCDKNSPISKRNQPADMYKLCSLQWQKTFMIKIFIGHYINVFYSTVDITLKKQPLLFLAKLMVYSAALKFHRKFSLQHDEENKWIRLIFYCQNNQELANESSRQSDADADAAGDGTS